MQRIICQHAQIPKKYIKKNINNLDYNRITEETKEAIEKLKNYIELKLYKKKMGILFYGDIGSGKTLFAILILKHLILNEGLEGRFESMSKIVDNIIRSDFTFIDVLLKYDVILLDDLDKLKATKGMTKSGWISEKIFDLFNDLTNNGKIIISTTNCQKVSELNDFFDSSVVSRIVGNSEVIKVKGEDYRIIERSEKIKGLNNVDQ